MGRMRENPRYNVISMRVSDEERDHLENLMKTTHKSISDIMREAMEYFSAHNGATFFVTLNAELLLYLKNEQTCDTVRN